MTRGVNQSRTAYNAQVKARRAKRIRPPGYFEKEKKRSLARYNANRDAYNADRRAKYAKKHGVKPKTDRALYLKDFHKENYMTVAEREHLAHSVNRARQLARIAADRAWKICHEGEMYAGKLVRYG